MLSCPNIFQFIPATMARYVLPVVFGSAMTAGDLPRDENKLLVVFI